MYDAALSEIVSSELYSLESATGKEAPFYMFVRRTSGRKNMVCGEPESGSRSSLVARQSGHGQAIPAQSQRPSHQEAVKACHYRKPTAKTLRPGRQSAAVILDNGQQNSGLGVCVSST
ncbi:hypothetical protein DPV78_011978 [Talaromyces pinophilus]|nr:hypothetical protein DPV78_011978 [Talaromyces pinophilus]